VEYLATMPRPSEIVGELARKCPENGGLARTFTVRNFLLRVRVNF
jgi:hypothetical protein